MRDEGGRNGASIVGINKGTAGVLLLLNKKKRGERWKNSKADHVKADKERIEDKKKGINGGRRNREGKERRRNGRDTCTTSNNGRKLVEGKSFKTMDLRRKLLGIGDTLSSIVPVLKRY